MMIDVIYGWVLDHWFILTMAASTVGAGIFAWASGNPVLATTTIYTDIKKYWKEIVIALLIIGSAAYIARLHLTIKDQEKQLAVDAVNIQTLTANVTTLQQTITDNNALVSKFDQFAHDTTQSFVDLDTTIAQRNDQLAKQVQGIMKEKKPVTCGDAIQYLILHGGTQ